MNETRIGQCGKRIYDSRGVAKKLARRVNDSGRENVQPYHCCKCHGWHLGTARPALPVRKRQLDNEMESRGI